MSKRPNDPDIKLNRLNRRHLRSEKQIARGIICPEDKAISPVSVDRLVRGKIERAADNWPVKRGVNRQPEIATCRAGRKLNKTMLARPGLRAFPPFASPLQRSCKARLFEKGESLDNLQIGERSGLDPNVSGRRIDCRGPGTGATNLLHADGA